MSLPEIPGYRILRPLNAGGMATVYLAEQLSLGREVAIKLIAEHLLTDAGFAERFAQEARIASRLDHPNIVTVFDYGSVPDGEGGQRHYLVMARVEGADYQQALPSLPLTARLRVIADIAAALGHAHAQGVVHRDIKPQNILVQAGSGRALLTDFGVARLSRRPSGLTGTGMTLGTPHYTAPEQALGQPVDARADIYSLGVVLYVSLTGVVPFDADSEVAIALRHINDPVPRLPETLARFQPAIDRALAKAPEQRYPDAESFAADLAAVPLEGLAVPTPAAPPDQPALATAGPAPTGPSPDAKRGAATEATRMRPAVAGWWSRYWHVPVLAALGLVLAVSLWVLWRADAGDARWVPAQPVAASPAPGPSAPASGTPAARSAPAPITGSGNLHCRFRVTGQSNDGWRGEIGLSNTGQSAYRRWRIDLRLPAGSRLTGSHHTRLEGRDGRYVLTPYDGQQALARGAGLTLGLEGTGNAPASLQTFECSGQEAPGRGRGRGR